MEKIMEVEKLWTREFIFGCLSNLFVFMSMYYLLPILPQFITDVFAGDKGMVGYVFGIFAFIGVITRPVAGYLLDVMGRKPIAWISITCLFLVMLSYNWITSLLLLMILRCIHGVCWGGATTSLATLVTDSIPLKQRGEGIGYYGLSISATFICLFFADSYVLFILSALLLGIGFGIIHSTAITLAINKVDASRRGVVNGTILTAFDLGFGIGSVFLGVLSNYTGLKMMYLASGCMVLIPFGIFYITHMMENKETEAINSN